MRMRAWPILDPGQESEWDCAAPRGLADATAAAGLLGQLAILAVAAATSTASMLVAGPGELQRHRIPPAPVRYTDTNWRQFLHTQATIGCGVGQARAHDATTPTATEEKPCGNRS
jgi:hypothetical protein